MYRNTLARLIKLFPDQIVWSRVSSNPNLTSDLIIKYLDKIDWNYLSRNPNLCEFSIDGELLIEKFQDKLNWKIISHNPGLTLDIVRKYKYRINWPELSLYFNIIPLVNTHDKLIEKNFHKLNWENLSRNPNLDPEFIEKYFHRFTPYQLSQNPCLFLKNQNGELLIEKYLKKLNWKFISFNPGLTPEFIEKYQDNLTWFIMAYNPALTIPLINKYLDRISPEDLSSNPNLTPGFIEKNLSKLNIFYISKNPNLTLDIIEKKSNKLNFELIWDNEFNQNPYVLKRKKKLYSQRLKSELIQEIEKREIKKNKLIYSLTIHELRMRIRDLENINYYK